MGSIFQAITNFWANVHNQQEVGSVLPDISYIFDSNISAILKNAKKIQSYKPAFIMWIYKI